MGPRRQSRQARRGSQGRGTTEPSGLLLRQVPSGRAAQGALHPSPQHPELGPGHRACSWPDSNELGQQSSERAGATKIRAAISTLCFEYWLLLHFTLMNKPFQGTPGGPSACEQVIREVGTYLDGYRKADAGTYGRCRELLPTAIQNAKRNRRSGGSSSTNVWELVERLQELRTMRRKRFPDGTRPFVFGATLHRVRFGLSIAAMAVTLRRAAYPLLLAPSPRDSQVQPRPSRGSSRRRGGVRQMMPASGSPGRLGVWPRCNARIRSRFRASGTPSRSIRAPPGTRVESCGCTYIWIPLAASPAACPTTTANPTSSPPISRPIHPTPTSP